MLPNPKILIIEDHDIVIWALKRIISTSLPDSVIFSATTFVDGMTLLEENPMDLVILDLSVPGANGVGMISDLRQILPDVRILVYTGMDENIYALQYLSAGANGFVSKMSEFSTVAEALKTVLRGKNYVSALTQSIISDNFFKGMSKEGNSENNFNLTVREKEVTRLLLQGKWTKEIADELDLKLTTISTHKGRIFEKFNVHNSIELFIKIQKELPWLLEELR